MKLYKSLHSAFGGALPRSKQSADLFVTPAKAGV
jgi:hypothetical protein